MELQSVKSRFKSLACCVVMPTYNNAKTLGQVLDGVLMYTQDIIVINDGSTDSTEKILKGYRNITVLTLKRNHGKGHALKIGFDRASSQKFDFAITLDSDGQHYPTDIPKFVERLGCLNNMNTLIIGDRNMNNADVFRQSAKGNRVSNFWVRATTGLELDDTQSGFRLYPIQVMNNIHFFGITKKFEFEVEAIIRCHWAGIRIDQVPIKVLYSTSERVSHFRPFMDIARIVILISWFLLVRFFYIIPRDFIRKIRKKGVKRFIKEDFLHNSDSPEKKALSIALGIFIGLSPLWGFHTIIVLFLAVLFKLNKVIAFAFSNISLPPFIPLVLYASVQTGQAVLGQGASVALADFQDNFNMVQQLESYVIGSMVLATTGSMIFGIIGYLILKVFERKNAFANA